MEIKAERQKINRIKADVGKIGVWLAGQLGKDPVTVSKWCTNTTQPDLYTLQKISTVLNAPIRSLLTPENQENKRIPEVINV